MKRKIITATLIAFCVLLIISYFTLPFITYVDRTIKSYTHINNYSVIEKVHNNHEWYSKISISQDDGEKLFAYFPFKHGYTTKAIAGKVQQNYIKDCGDCWYYINDKGVGLYGYILYCLSSDKKQLEIYQAFGD